MAGFECWVTIGDVDGLDKWQQIFGDGHKAAFVFVYRIENIDVDFDGMDVLEFDDSTYFFLSVTLENYRRFMRRRSPRWQTVTLPARKFRETAMQISDLLL